MLDRKSSTNSHSMAEFSQNFMKTGTPKVKIFPTAPPVYYEEVEEEFKPIQVEEVIKTPVFTGRGLGLHGVKPISIKINPSPVSRRESGVTFGVATPLLPPNKSSQRNKSGLLIKMNTSDSWQKMNTQSSAEDTWAGKTSNLTVQNNKNNQLVGSDRPSAQKPALHTFTIKPRARQKMFGLQSRSLERATACPPIPSTIPSRSPDPVPKSTTSSNWSHVLRSTAEKTRKLEGMFFLPSNIP